MAKITPALKHTLNTLADMMLMVDGFESYAGQGSMSEMYDCSTSDDPRCQKAWNKAVTAYAFLNKHPGLLVHQVKLSGANILQFN